MLPSAANQSAIFISQPCALPPPLLPPFDAHKNGGGTNQLKQLAAIASKKERNPVLPDPFRIHRVVADGNQDARAPPLYISKKPFLSPKLTSYAPDDIL